MNAGRLLIILTFGIAIAGAAGAWLHRYYQTDEVQRRFGPTTLGLIMRAPQVIAHVRIGEEERSQKDVTRAPGMLNIRHMLASDFSYGDRQEMMLPTQWSLEFIDGDRRVRFGFHHDCRAAMDETSGSTATVVDEAASNIRSFFAEQFPEESKQMDRFWKVDK